MAKHAVDGVPEESVEEQSEAVELTESEAVVEEGLDDAVDAVAVTEAPEQTGQPTLALAAVVGLVIVALLAGLTGWLGYQAYESYRAQQQRDRFVAVGRQAATNLTSIDWEHVDEDVQRVLDVATGTFYDDFSKRVESFTEVVKQAKSKSSGTVDEAGVVSETDGGAKVLVAVTVNTSNVGAPTQPPRGWRMLLTVQKIGDEAKVSNVEFVS